MASRLISGTDISEQIYGELRARIATLKERGITPGLAVVLVGEDPASQTYVRMKGRKCEELGMHSVTITLPAKVIEAIDPAKDVDGFHPVNVGRMLIGKPGFLPATPAGVMEMLRRSGVETAGKHAVIVGRSNIVGKPMAALLVQKGADATVTVAHSRTADLGEVTRTADILIAAVGRPRFITADMVKDGVVVIDVGTNRIDDPTHPKGSRLVGDVDFEAVRDKASAITPVPKGVGPMTICMLMANAVKAAEEQSR